MAGVIGGAIDVASEPPTPDATPVPDAATGTGIGILVAATTPADIMPVLLDVSGGLSCLERTACLLSGRSDGECAEKRSHRCELHRLR